MKKKVLTNIFLTLALLISALFLLSSGEYPVDIWDQLLGNSSSEIEQNIFWKHRFPILIVAILSGISLSSAGFVLQELFQNPLAGPSVLGISSASGLGVALYVFLYSKSDYMFIPNEWATVVFSFGGAIVLMLFISIFAFKIQNNESLIILGLVISGFASAIVSFLQYLAPAEQIKVYLIWGFGKLGGLSENQLIIFSVLVFIGLFLIYFCLKPLQKMLLGEQYAKSMGLRILPLRILVFFASALLVAASTAFTGPILFVGMIVPFVCRYILRTTDFVYLWWVIMAISAIVMILFARLSQIIPGEIVSINIVASIFGAPAVIIILWILRYRQFR